jgi:ABC-type lipoprotein release transport system permease subunit
MLRISLRRSRADWPIVASAGLVCLLAATLLAAGSIYGTAVSVAGLHRALADAPTAEAAIDVSGSIPPAEAEAVDATVTGELDRTFGPTGGQTLRFAETNTYALPGQPADAVRDLAVLGSAEALADHATLILGVWPQDAAADPTAAPVAIGADVAERLDLEIGERLTLESRIDPGSTSTIAIVGVFRIDDPGAEYWWGDTQLVDGLTVTERFDTHGPFFTTDRALRAASGARSIELTWRAYPASAAMTLDEVGPFRARVADLAERLRTAADGTVNVRTGLPDLLARTERSLLVTRAGVLVLTLQLVVLAAYAVLLSASLLVEHRRIDTAMLRSRGAGTSRIVALALVEGLVLTIPAVLAAPWLAAALLRGFNLTGPLADIALAIEPGVTADAYAAAAAAGVICLFALTLPVLRTARTYASIHGTVARGETRGIAQRLGLDIALLVVAVIGLWQLRHYGAPLTRSVQGAIGLDPLLVATPAIGLVAGAIVALRLVPLLAELIERGTTRLRSLVPSLGARQLSRRPLRYTRASLLLMLAMSMGVFAVSYTWTWSASQADQATFQVGADLRVQPGTGSGSPPRGALDRVYAGLPGVTARMPVERETVPTSRTSRTSRLLAVDASVAGMVMDLRADQSDVPVAELMAPLVAARPSVVAVRLPGEPRQLRLVVEAAIRKLQVPEYDMETDTVTYKPVSLDEIAGWRGLGASVVVRDARGLLHRFDGGSATIDHGPHELIVPLGGTRAAPFAYPLELLGVELSVSLPAPYEAPDATVSVGALAAAGGDGAWRPVSLELATGWRSTVAFYGGPQEPLDTGIRGAILTAVTGGPGLSVLPPADENGRAVVLAFAPASIADVADAPIPIVASDRFIDALGVGQNGKLGLIVGGVRRDFVVSATVRALPATDPADPSAVVDLATWSLLRYEGGAAVETVDEWWLSVADGQRAAVAGALARPPIVSRAVFDASARGRSLATDPVALGTIGALAIGFVAAAAFAVVGFIVSASVSARERIAEFALLRALGLSSGQLSVWLSMENALLASISLLAGIVLGLVVSWVVLPFITVTAGAATPYPPVEVVVPWTAIGVLAAGGILALGATVIALAWLLPRIGLASVLRMSED